jgi:multidrug efflux pump subunit AcrA (membrane-fusion protein)
MKAAHKTSVFRIVSLLAAPALCAALAVGCQRPKQETVEVKSVTAAPVRRATLDITVKYPARIKPREEIVVSAKISGRVAGVAAAVGQAVSAGDILFTLESKDYDAQYRQARAALESAQASLTRTNDSALSGQVMQAQAAVDQGQVQNDDAQDVFNRTQKLFDGGSVSRQQLDSVEAKAKSAAIALSTAKDSLALIQQKSGPQSSSVVSAQVEQARATADLAQSQIDNTIITSPINGVVSMRNIDPGELVSPSVPAFMIIDTATVIAEASVSDRMLEKIAKGERVSVTVSLTGSRREGTVDTVSPSVDPRTLGYTVKIALPNPGALLKPGMFATIAFPVEKRRNILTVPNGAVVTESGVDYVLAVLEGRISRKPVGVGTSDEAVTEITTGLAEGDLVVTEGQSFLSDGERVSVVP